MSKLDAPSSTSRVELRDGNRRSTLGSHEAPGRRQKAGQQSAVDGEFNAGDIAAAVVEQQGDRVSYLGRAGSPAGRYLFDPRPCSLLVLIEIFCHRGSDVAGAHA